MQIVILIIFILMVAGMGGAAYWQIKKTDPKNHDISLKDNIASAEDFVPFEDIKDGAICLGGDKYRAIVEVGCLNYFLRTETEQNVIESTFSRFLNSLRYPVTFFVQTRTISNEKMIKNLDADLQTVLSKFPDLQNYAQTYVEGITNLENYIGNGKNKQYYVIIPYDDAASMEGLDGEERYSYGVKELHVRAQQACEGLKNCGLSARILGTEELAELIIMSYHRSDLSALKAFFGLDFARLLVEDNGKEEIPPTAKEQLEKVLYEFENRLRLDIPYEQLPANIAEEFGGFKAAFNDLYGKLRKEGQEEIEIKNPFYDEEEQEEGEGSDRVEYDELI